MKKSYSALAAVLSGALVFTGVGPVAAAEDGAIADDLRDAIAVQTTASMTATSNTIDVAEGSVSAPTATGGEIEIELPGDPSAMHPDDDLILNVTATENYTTALEDTGNGSFRALVHIESASAPTEYRFELSDNVELIPLEDGGVTARDAEGNVLGIFAPPWALDAQGVELPTSYQIEGTSLIQNVTFSANTSFPVVADPFWIPALLVVARFTAHALTQAAAKGVSQKLITQVVQNGVRSAGNKGTSVFTQGRGVNKIRVIVDNKTGNIITVTKG